MPNEKVKTTDELSIKKETVDKKGKVKKTTFFFPTYGVSVEAKDQKEALKLAKKKAKNNN
ncbi:MAG: hypothetical protein U9O78_02050 [Patescibacteria group bacterium]|nr:hypothetical protein [Patescibacteria group bacterium]